LEVVNLGALDSKDIEGPVTPQLLEALGLIRGAEFPVKILAGGELSKKIEVHAQAFSAAAKETIEAQGGTIVILERTDRWVTARPRTRRLPIDRDLKTARLGKVGGIERRTDLGSS
jgi:hypothetical protein